MTGLFLQMARWLGAGLTLLLIGAIAAFVLFTGPRNVSAYPDSAASPYVLPWQPGKTHLCVQGNNAVVSHRGWEEYAYDFAMPVGTPICAARAGEVISVVVEHDGNGIGWPNNRISVLHEDGSIGHYLHLRRQGSKVSPGDRVEQRQVIAESGHVGNSMLPHLHFHVTDGKRRKTLPVRFADVSKDDGVPRMFGYYTAGGLESE